MGDARRSKGHWQRPGTRRRGKLPAPLLAWGLGAAIGHNNGPPLEEDAPGYLWRRYRWTKVHAAAWMTPSMSVLKFRVARADAAGLDYRAYMSRLLDTGRFAQASDQDAQRAVALRRVRSAGRDVLARVAPDALPMQRAIVVAALTGAYDDVARVYHNLVHIAAVLDALEGVVSADDPNRDALVLAALFHDLVYDARSGDNEIESARVAALHLGDLGVAAGLVARVVTMIEATRHRPEDVVAADAETALLLDCDLAVLAAAPDAYRAYADAVRREYAHVPDAAFHAGRARVLRAFLARPRLYATVSLAALWEAAARENLATECAELERL